MFFDRDAAIVMSIENVDALKAVSKQYRCGIVTEHGMVEQPDGDIDLENTRMSDGMFATTFAQANPPTEDATDDQVDAVAALSLELDAPWLFETVEAAGNARAALDDSERWKVVDDSEYGLFAAALVPA